VAGTVQQCRAQRHKWGLEGVLALGGLDWTGHVLFIPRPVNMPKADHLQDPSLKAWDKQAAITKLP